MQTKTHLRDYNQEFWDIINEEFPTLVGKQKPEVFIHSQEQNIDFSHGIRAIKFAERIGYHLMPWQRLMVKWSLAQDEHGRWLHAGVTIICPRQNGKSLIAEIVILYRLFYLNERIIFTAQRWKTAASIRGRIWSKIKSIKSLTKKITRNTNSAGDAEIELNTGAKLQFSTRSADAGRGFDEVDVLFLDEAYNLDASELSALAPIQLAAKDPQTFYTSSAVNRNEHIKGIMLSDKRRKILGGETKRQMYAEFRAPEGCDPDDPSSWELANPSYGVVQSEEKVLDLKSKLTKESFLVEILGHGLWYEDEDETPPVISKESWQEMFEPNPEQKGSVAIAVDMSPGREDRECTVIAAIGTENGAHLEIGYHGPVVIDEIVKRISRIVETADPLAAMIDPVTPAAMLIEPLKKADIEPETMRASDVKTATATFLQYLDEGRITHNADPIFAKAIDYVDLREIGHSGGVAFTSKPGGNVTPIIAAANAVWRLYKHDEPKEKPRTFTGIGDVSVPDFEDDIFGEVSDLYV